MNMDPEGHIYMAAPLHQKKLRFSDVAYAVESTPKALRKMLQNPTLVMPAAETDGWTNFSLVQVAVLTIARRLIEFGFSVGWSSLNGCMIVLEAIVEVEGRCSPKFTVGAFLRLLSDSYAIVHLGSEAPRIDIVHSKRWPTPHSELQVRPVLIVPIGAVVKRAFDRAFLGSDEDISGSEASLLAGIQKLTIIIEDAIGDLQGAVDATSETARVAAAVSASVAE